MKKRTILDNLSVGTEFKVPDGTYEKGASEQGRCDPTDRKPNQGYKHIKCYPILGGKIQRHEDLVEWLRADLIVEVS